MVQIFILVFIDCHAMITLSLLCFLNCIVISSFYRHNSRDQCHAYESRLYRGKLGWIIDPLRSEGKPLLNEEALGQY